jgi:hypothetical protein
VSQRDRQRSRSIVVAVRDARFTLGRICGSIQALSPLIRHGGTDR